MWGLPKSLLTDHVAMRAFLVGAAKQNKATVVNHIAHELDPPGFSILIALNESHIAVHTYADEGCLAMDVFTCGEADSSGIFDSFLLWVQQRAGNGFMFAKRVLPRFVKGLQWEGEHLCAYC